MPPKSPGESLDEPRRDFEHALAENLGLSARQAEVVAGLCEGRQEKAIARHLGVSVHTVHHHVKEVYQKLDVHDRAELLLLVVLRTCPHPENPGPPT